MARYPPSVRLRQNATQTAKREPKKDRKPNQNHIKSEPKPIGGGGLIFPGGDTAFKALLSARFCAAIWSHVTDCDETYNYWEPMHYLVFGKGLQTWEYSPDYALRSYTYLLLHATPAFIYHKLLQPNPLLIFYFVRCLLGLLSAFAEVYFYKAVCKEFGVHIGRLTLAFQLFSAGMFISSTALLPSSWAMYAVSAACAAWWQMKYALAIFLIAIASLLGKTTEICYKTCFYRIYLYVGWPFAALLGVPIAFDVLFLKKLYKTFICWTAISGIVILGPMVAIDSAYYGTLVIAPWNIVKYNILDGSGPELYGTEPFSFYFINGFLNFNIIWVFALLLPVALLFSYWFVPAKGPSTLSLPHAVSLAPIALWLTVFMFQPHKEERFLFPIYPLICLCGAITIDICQKLWFRIYCYFKNPPQGSHYLDYTVYITLGTIILSSILGVSRILSLYKNYHAPLDLMMELNKYPTEENVPNDLVVNVCLGKDWYRYPSSFFLPNTNWNIRFIQSEFRGILPAPYSDQENATKIVHKHFNDRNQEEPSLYFDISKCHFLVDLATDHETALEPNYATQIEKWKQVKVLPFLNADKSHLLLRSFYIPYMSYSYNTFSDFYLLQAIKK